MDASPTEESISAELRKLGGNLLGMLQTLWRRPERQKADKLIRHQLYSALRLTNRELEKAMQNLTPPPGEPANIQPSAVVDPPGNRITGIPKEG